MPKTEKPKGQFLLRQKLLAKLLVEDSGKTPIGRLMLRAGYKKAYTTNPKQLRKTASWQELMEKNLPDKLLAEKHKELLNKKEYIAIGKKGEREVVATGEIDPYAVSRGLELGYKIKNKFPAEKHTHKIETVEIVKYGEPKLK